MVNRDYIKKLMDICNLIYFQKANIYKEITKTDENSNLTTNELTLIYENIPCRVSSKNGSSSLVRGSSRFTDTANIDNKNEKIFMDKNISVFVGDKVVVKKDSVEYTYVVNGEPNIYTSHQEFFVSQLSAKKTNDEAIL